MYWEAPSISTPSLVRHPQSDRASLCRVHLTMQQTPVGVCAIVRTADGHHIPGTHAGDLIWGAGGGSGCRCREQSHQQQGTSNDPNWTHFPAVLFHNWIGRHTSELDWQEQQYPVRYFPFQRYSSSSPSTGTQLNCLYEWLTDWLSLTQLTLLDCRCVQQFFP